MEFCEVCGKKVVFLGKNNALCEECGQEELCYADIVDAYVYTDEYSLHLRDDDLSDLEIFQYIGDTYD